MYISRSFQMLLVNSKYRQPMFLRANIIKFHRVSRVAPIKICSMKCRIYVEMGVFCHIASGFNVYNYARAVSSAKFNMHITLILP